jgi:dUTP pyrophosphatase
LKRKETMSKEKELYDKMQQRIFDIINPEIDYTQDDFDEEFGMLNSPSYDFLNKIQFNFVNKSTNPNPEYATEGSSGFDLRANLLEPITIQSGKFAIIPTGLFFEIPPHFEIQVRPRSGLAAKFGVTVLNTPGTVDSDYRGEVKVILINHGEADFTVNHGDRIAQGVIASVIGKNVISFNQTTEISDDTQRSSGGFGSTGFK